MKTIKMNYLLCVGAGTALLLTSCATIYESKDFSSLKKQHKTFAVLPFEVSIDRENLPKKVTEEIVREQEKQEGRQFQNSLYVFLLKEQANNGYSVSVQDIDKTNVLLSKAGITSENMSKYNKQELAAICGVDAVMSGKIHSKKKMSEGLAIATGIVSGFFIGTFYNYLINADNYYYYDYYNNNYYYSHRQSNDAALWSCGVGAAYGLLMYQAAAGSLITMDINLHDGRNSDLIWSYSHRIGGYKGISLANSSRRLMKQISRQLPYTN